MNDRGLELTAAPARLPSSQDSPSFRYHLERTAPMAVAAAAVHTVAVPMMCGLAGWALFGAAGFLPAGAVGCLGALAFLNWIPLIGNRALRANLSRTLGKSKGWTFVGLRAVQGSLVQEARRVETDDNVGFLRVTEKALEVATEGGALQLSRESIRGFSAERMLGLPYLHYIRVEFEENGQLKAFLFVSREGSSVQQHRRSTDRLRDRLVEWHADHQLEWLADQGR
ncbi:MAG: hypothetical protein AAF449_13390 [Myxococcota bacterium]